MCTGRPIVVVVWLPVPVRMVNVQYVNRAFNLIRNPYALIDVVGSLSNEYNKTLL